MPKTDSKKIQVGLKLDNILRIKLSPEELLLLSVEDRQNLQKKLSKLLKTVNESLGIHTS